MYLAECDDFDQQVANTAGNGRWFPPKWEITGSMSLLHPEFTRSARRGCRCHNKFRNVCNSKHFCFWTGEGCGSPTYSNVSCWEGGEFAYCTSHSLQIFFLLAKNNETEPSFLSTYLESFEVFVHYPSTMKVLYRLVYLDSAVNHVLSA
jgi:hypothetical protein